ncbi:MAG: IclR family transcriptional regulator [Firmicutes bacterium]|nr:IclR family transcriptional regulator [Bacillota bacterium]MCL5971414.1 IclR family transcriptional regulator [Bacillota bacterium]
MKNNNVPEGAQAVERVLSILEYVAQRQTPVKLGEIAESMKLHRNTAYRLARTLVAKDYLDVEDGAYTLGPMAIVLGQSQSRENVLLRKCEPYLQQLCDTTREVTNLGILRADEVFYLGRWEDKEYRAGVFVRSGQRAPLYASALGKIFLAAMTQEERNDYYARCPWTVYTSHTIVHKEGVDEAVQRAQLLGYAEDEEELSYGVRCVAVPVLVNERVIAAVSIAVPTIRFTPESQSQCVGLLRETTKRLSKELGGHQSITQLLTQ